MTFLKKIVLKPLSERREMVDKADSSLSIKQQCQLLGIHRSGLYYKPCGKKEENLEILRQMDEQYLKTPFYGVRRLTAWLRQEGYKINAKRVKRLMLVSWGKHTKICIEREWQSNINFAGHLK